MASSQVEIASSSSSSSPFGCVLRDHNRRVRWSNRKNSTTAFHNNFNDFVHNISGQTRNPASDSNHNSHHLNHTDLWVHTPTYTIHQNDHSSHNAGQKCDRPENFVFPGKGDGDGDGDAITQNRGSSAPVTPFRRENSPDQSDTCLEISNLGGGVSSLVRKWRDFEAEAKTFAASNSPVSTTRSNSGSIFAENASNEVYESTQLMNEDPFGGWESDRTALSAPTSSSQGRDSDVTENERLRVVDIIRKLTDNNNDGEHGVVGSEWLPRVRTSYEQSPEQRPFSPVVVGSPRLRGRQAFCDLLMQMERDRHKELQRLVERKAVSRFSHKGRIQAMLRVQFLRRGAEVKHRQPSNCTASQSNRLAQSSIMQLRERFKPVSQHVAFDFKISRKEMADNNPRVEKLSNASSLTRKDSHQEEVTALTCPYAKAADNIIRAEYSCTSNIVAEYRHLETKATMDKSSLQAPRPKNVYREASPTVDVLQQRENVETKTGGLLQSAEARSSFNGMKEDRHAEKEDAKGQQLIEISNNSLCYNADMQSDLQLTETSHNSASSSPHPPCDWEDEGAGNHYLSESEHCWVSDVSHRQVGWEELHSDYEQQAETSQNWANDISRPRSEWEGLRQARYQEMLDPFLENEEICQLLQRKSVSSFLSSGLRETIDRLMISRSQDQPNALRCQTEKEKRVIGEEEEEREGEQEGEDEEEEEEEESHNAGYDDDYEDNEEDDKSEYGEYDNFEEYGDQIIPSLASSSWNHNQGTEASENSDQVASPILHQNTSPNSYSVESRPCSSVVNNSSMEMELIFELRGHMEQLHQEMFELRKSIKSCMNMHLKYQGSVGDSGKRRGKRDSTQKGICCICYQLQIDSLLYRCGHMCTCVNCAHQLQWNSGRCPVCEAPIIDVVRVVCIQ